MTSERVTSMQPRDNSPRSYPVQMGNETPREPARTGRRKGSYPASFAVSPGRSIHTQSPLDLGFGKVTCDKVLG
ncbi:hypothetical protein RRF57_002154 [Xylaria bambusicola]|uniref:Uncharacterized protein n=1 Tax=Xylaria bambusicola TaxID=326684 RepID=A0AAN7UCL1_9PEZI